MTLGTYSTRPFITHDGVDENGIRAEVKVVAGYGLVDNIEKSKAGKSAKVSFSVENTDFTISGWAPVDSKVMEVCQEALKSESPIYFRVETLRKKNVDRTLPIMEISKGMEAARDNTYKSLASVRADESDDWTFNEFAVTNPLEDPKTSAGRHSALDMDIEATPASAAQSGGARANSYPVEPPPYVSRMNNGELNLGSIAVGVPASIYDFVCEYTQSKGIEYSPKDRWEMTKMILEAANEVQVRVVKLESANLSLGSHTRARSLVYSTVRYGQPMPETFFENEEDSETWVKSLTDKASKLWEMSIRLSEPHIP